MKYIGEKKFQIIPDNNLRVWLFVNILSMRESQLENRVGNVITGTNLISFKNQDNKYFHEFLASQY